LNELRLLRRLYGFCARTMALNTEGLDEESTRRVPEEGGNTANWIAGHVVRTRVAMLGLMGREVPFDRDRFEIYRRGAAPPSDEELVPFAEILDAYRETQSVLDELFESAEAGDLDQPVAEPDAFLGETVGEALVAFGFHESYHVGQLGLRRRLAGKPGAIS
jgi:hypothetical protein